MSCADRLAVDDPVEFARVARSRVWFYRPSWYFGGWNWWVRWMPAWFGSDEIGRRTLVLGHNVTGQVVIAVGRPGGACGLDC